MENILRLLHNSGSTVSCIYKAYSVSTLQGGKQYWTVRHIRTIFFPSEYRMDSREIWSGHSSTDLEREVYLADSVLRPISQRNCHGWPPTCLNGQGPCDLILF